MSQGKAAPAPQYRREDLPPAGPASEARRKYWAGADAEGPAWAYQLAGVTFPVTTDTVVRSSSGAPDQRHPKTGTVVALTDEQVAAVRAAAHKVAVRAEGARKVLVECRRHGHVRRPTDYPVGAHVYLVPLEAAGAYPEGTLPPRLLPRDGRLVSEGGEWVLPPTYPAASVIEEAQKAAVLRAVMAGDQQVLEALGLGAVKEGIALAAKEAGAKLAGAAAR